MLSLLLGSALILGVLAGSAAATPWTGPEPTPTNLLFYLHNSSLGIPVGSARFLNVLSTVNDSQSPWASSGAVSVSSHYDAVSFVAAPAFAAPLLLNGTVDATVYLNQSGSSPTGGSIVLTVDAVAPNGALTPLGTGPATATAAIGPGSSVPTLVFLAGPTLHATIPTGSSLEVNVTINGNTAENYGVWWGLVGGTYYVSSVSVPASTYLTVPSVAVLNTAGQAVSVLPTSVANTTVTVRAVVADPLGAYDFENFSVDFSVLTSNGTVAIAPTPMHPAPVRAAPNAPNGTYELAFNYSGLAAGTYNFTVNATDNTEHNLAGQVTLPAYYGRIAFSSARVSVGLPPVPVLIGVVDDHGRSLSGALVAALSAGTPVASGRTNATGQVSFELPAGSQYDFAVSWEGISVGEFLESVTNNSTQFVLHAAVVYPTFDIVAATGAPLPYPLITVIHPNGTAYPLIVGSASGQFSLAQVPAGNYTLTVVYDDSQVVFGATVTVGGDGPFEVVAAHVFALTVRATTSSGGGLSGVFVAVVNATTGSTIASGLTNGSGSLTFLVPAGNYTVTGTWAATYDLTSLQQTVTVSAVVAGATTATLDFTQAYPPVYSTTLFDVALVVAFLVAATLLFAVLWLRARRRAGRPPSGTPAVAEWKEEPTSKAEKSTEGGSGPSSADRKSGGPGSSS